MAQYVDLIKRAFHISWRYRVLWVFGFFLALCSGSFNGSGGGNFPADSMGSADLPFEPDAIDMNTVLLIVAAVLCLIVLFIVVGIIVRNVCRVALIRMVHQIDADETTAFTVREGWQLGWSVAARRTFLVALFVGIPVFIGTVILVAVALSPLLLLMSGEEAFIALGIMLTIVLVLAVVLLLILVTVVIVPIQELAWRYTTLHEQKPLASLESAFQLIKQRFKDVLFVWLWTFGIGIAWAVVSIIVVLPIALIAGFLIGGLPAGLVYFLSGSDFGAAVIGIPLGLLVFLVCFSFGNGLYLTYHSAIWTLAFVKLHSPRLLQ